MKKYCSVLLCLLLFLTACTNTGASPVTIEDTMNSQKTTELETQITKLQKEVETLNQSLQQMAADLLSPSPEPTSNSSVSPDQVAGSSIPDTSNSPMLSGNPVQVLLRSDDLPVLEPDQVTFPAAKYQPVARSFNEKEQALQRNEAVKFSSGDSVYLSGFWFETEGRERTKIEIIDTGERKLSNCYERASLKVGNCVYEGLLFAPKTFTVSHFASNRAHILIQADDGCGHMWVDVFRYEVTETQEVLTHMLKVFGRIVSCNRDSITISRLDYALTPFLYEEQSTYRLCESYNSLNGNEWVYEYNSTFVKIPSGCTPIGDSLILRSDLSLYDRDGDTPFGVISAGSTIYLAATDGARWVYIVDIKTGLSGWFSYTNTKNRINNNDDMFSQAVLVNGTMYMEEVFETDRLSYGD